MLQKNGNLEVYSSTGVDQLMWDTGINREVGPRYWLIFQADGNMVVYKDAGLNVAPEVIWSAETYISSCKDLFVGSVKMQNDGNFVVYDRDGMWVWQSGSTKVVNGKHVPWKSDSKHQKFGEINPAKCTMSELAVKRWNEANPKSGASTSAWETKLREEVQRQAEKKEKNKFCIAC